MNDNSLCKTCRNKFNTCKAQDIIWRAMLDPDDVSEERKDVIICNLYNKKEEEKDNGRNIKKV